MLVYRFWQVLLSEIFQSHQYLLGSGEMIVLTNVQSVGQCHRHQGQNYPCGKYLKDTPQISEAMRHQKYRPQDHRPNNFLERYFLSMP